MRLLGLLPALAGALAFGFVPARAQVAFASTDSARSTLFVLWEAEHPRELWSAMASTTAKQAATNFDAGVRLPNGYVYGASVKGLQVAGRTAVELDAELVRAGFDRFDSTATVKRRFDLQFKDGRESGRFEGHWCPGAPRCG